MESENKIVPQVHSQQPKPLNTIQIQTKQLNQPVTQTSNSQLLLKSNLGQDLRPTLNLYVYGSCQSDQFRHPKKLSQSKRPICITTQQTFDLNEEDDQQSMEKLLIVPNPLFKKIIYKIACGGLHSIVLTTDGLVYTFGCNDEGALGRQGHQSIPQQVKLQDLIDMISAGDNHSMFANSVNGYVYFTGNYNYLRGQKMVENVKVPVKFTTTQVDIRNKHQPIKKLVSGANHTCILIKGRIFCRGQPEAFTTGRRINQRRKTQSSLTFDGVGLNHVQDVWCGGYHSIAKVKKGQIWAYFAWGTNDQGQLGIGNFKSQAYPVEIKNLRGINVIQVAIGTSFTLFLTDIHEIYACGANQYGQLGFGQDYQFVNSQVDSQQQREEEQRKERELNKVVQNMNISQKQKKDLKNIVAKSNGEHHQEKQENLRQAQKMQEEAKPAQISQQRVEQPEISQQKKKLGEFKNIYIKSVRKLQYAFERPITNIGNGSQFVFAWNEEQLYSWGFGMNYVLLNGGQQEQFEPFKVKSKIINEESICQLSAGGQHVLYTAYSKKNKPQVKLDEKVGEVDMKSYGRLSRKKRS